MALYEDLKAALADTTSMYFMAHSAHWNVKGDDFPAMHEFFERIYSEVYSAIDPLAEHIRAIGGMAPVSLNEVCASSSVDEMKQPYNSDGMVRYLRSANRRVLDSLNRAFVSASGNQGLQNFLAERLDQHAKHQWMLDATSGE